MMRKKNMWRGKQVRLTAVTPNDLPVLTRWWQDAEFQRLYDGVPAYPKTEAQLAKRVEDGQKGDTVFLFAIRPAAGEEIIGLLEFDGVMWPHGTSYISIGIGQAENRGKGYGREAMQLGLDYAFNELNLHRVSLVVFSYNQSAIKLYESLGFVREGVYREALHRDGRRHDMYLYGILRREWAQNKTGG